MRLRASVGGVAVWLACSQATLVQAQTRPMIERIVPTAGPPGTRVRIEGRGFSRGLRVLFNEHPVTPTEVLPERITVTVPDGAESGRFVLAAGTDETESPETFRVTERLPPPVVRSVDPSTAAPGTEITIRGDNFAARPSDNAVRVGAVPMVVRAGDSGSLRVIIPDGAASGPVFVRTAGGEARSGGDLAIGARLSVREIIPTAIAPGGHVLLRGAGFAPTAALDHVTLGGRQVRVVRATATELEVEVPIDGTSGTIAVEISGAGRYETAQRLFVGPAPIVRVMEPTSGPPGARVTLRGDHFGSDASRVTVTFGAANAAVVSAAPTALVVTVPEGAASGHVAVTAAGVGPVLSPTEFRAMAAVSVARVDPRACDIGERVTLTGTGFSAVAAENTVQLGSVIARVVSASPTELVVEVPEGARSGNWTVAVAGSGNVRSREPFMVTLRPRITALEPERGIPGTRLTLRGANFPADRSLASVRLNGADVPIESYARDAIVVTVPRDGQTGRFQVIGRLQGTGTAPMEFFVLQPVLLTSVDPPAGPLGSTVTLRGSGFEPDPARLSVRLGPQLVRPTHNSTTEIVFTVPRNSRGGSITIEADGRQPASSTQPFAITVPPVVTAVVPPAASPGARVVIRGRNFGRDLATVGVTIGTLTCPTSAVTPTTIECQVPEGAQTGPLTVRVANAGEARASAPFRVLPAAAPRTPAP
jgi:hypothetical protein